VQCGGLNRTVIRVPNVNEVISQRILFVGTFKWSVESLAHLNAPIAFTRLTIPTSLKDTLRNTLNRHLSINNLTLGPSLAILLFKKTLLFRF